MDGLRRERIDGPGAYDGCVVPPRMVMLVVEDSDDGDWVGVFMAARVVVEGGAVQEDRAYARAERRLRERQCEDQRHD